MKTIYNWIARFLLEGFSWLVSKHYQGRGRKSKLTKAQRQELYTMIEAGPEANGFECGVWTTAMIAELILLKCEVTYNPRYLSSVLKKLGITYQKACFISDRLDEKAYQKKRQEWVENTWPGILRTAKETNAVILFGDEVSFRMWGSLARTWAPRGKQPVAKTKGIRKGLKMFGAIECGGGDFHYLESLSDAIMPKSLRALKKEEQVPQDVLVFLTPLKHQKYSTQEQFLMAIEEAIGQEQVTRYRAQILRHTEAVGTFNGETYVKFLTQLLAHFTRPVMLIEDGAPYHNARVVTAFQKTHAHRLTLHRLPPFSPDKNPIETLWKNTKRDATHLKYFATFEQLRTAVVKVFRTYLDDATTVISVMKKLRTEAGLL
ncbi:MAG: IS630 family transposase [bacterium]|nr:IS630 family transposase [bacterium]